MIIKSKENFINQVKSFDIDTEYVVVKPNWISNTPGEFTEAEVLDWLLSAFPVHKKIVIESYTPWRGQIYAQNAIDRQEDDDLLKVNLEGGIDYWDFYKDADTKFLKETGNDEVLKKHNAEYICVTNEFWAKDCVSPETIKGILTNHNHEFFWPECLSFMPRKLYELGDKATLVSLAKVKQEPSIPEVAVNLSLKNFFGLIPAPSRWVPYHDKGHTLIPNAIAEMCLVYTSVFKNSLWINEGTRTSLRNYCEHSQTIDKDLGLFFAGRDGLEVDSETCRHIGLVPENLIQLNTIKQILKPR